MGWKHPRIPYNSVAATLLLMSLILLGGGILNWHSARLQAIHEAEVVRQAAENHQTLPKTPKAQVLRAREKIALFNDVPDKMTVAPAGDKAQVIYHVTTDKPVIFITIDDGTFKDPQTAQFMRERELPYTSFLTVNDIKSNFDFFNTTENERSHIQNHTITHPHMPKLPLEAQRSEICGTSDTLKQHYSWQPIFFRPPYGEFNENTLKAAAGCGIKAVVNWTVVVQQGEIHYQKDPHLHPGDIVLLHYKPELKSDLAVLLKVAHEQGMEIAQLEDWIQ